MDRKSFNQKGAENAIRRCVLLLGKSNRWSPSGFSVRTTVVPEPCKCLARERLSLYVDVFEADAKLVSEVRNTWEYSTL